MTWNVYRGGGINFSKRGPRPNLPMIKYWGSNRMSPNLYGNSWWLPNESGERVLLPWWRAGLGGACTEAIIARCRVAWGKFKRLLPRRTCHYRYQAKYFMPMCVMSAEEAAILPYAWKNNQVQHPPWGVWTLSIGIFDSQNLLARVELLHSVFFSEVFGLLCWWSCFIA